MSLGFLTESALLPSKAKEIKVDSKSILDLKAVVFQKEQERKERRRRLHDEAGGDEPDRHRRKRSGRDHEGGGGMDGDAMGNSVYARLKASKRSRKEKDRNRGVDERRKRDDEQRELDVNDSDDDAALQQKSREMLQRKTKLYEQMMQGKRDAVPAAAAKECLVDFDGKRRATEAHSLVADGEYDAGSETVEITDEFGRTRVVERGSSEHVECTRRNRHEQHPNALFFEDKRDDRKRAEWTSRGGATGSFVVSQWEKTLKCEEKQYLEQVHASVERAKQSAPTLTDKQRRKQLRLEKLKQQQRNQDHPPQPSVSLDEPINKDPQQDTNAAVQATAFLSQFTSLM